MTQSSCYQVESGDCRRSLFATSLGSWVSMTKQITRAYPRDSSGFRLQDKDVICICFRGTAFVIFLCTYWDLTFASFLFSLAHVGADTNGVHRQMIRGDHWYAVSIYEWFHLVLLYMQRNVSIPTSECLICVQKNMIILQNQILFP